MRTDTERLDFLQSESETVYRVIDRKGFVGYGCKSDDDVFSSIRDAIDHLMDERSIECNAIANNRANLISLGCIDSGLL